MRLFAVHKTATVLMCLFWTLPALGQAPTDPDPAEFDYEAGRLEKVVQAIRITEEIALDGYLDEAAWDIAPPAANFIQRRPVPGGQVIEPTEARFLYDDENVYVGVILFDSVPSEIVINELEEDFSFQSSDVISIAFDSLHELRSGFIFTVNAGGAKLDSQTTDGTFNEDWDAVWDVRTHINDVGWVAELVIPFKTLRFSSESSQVWGLNVSRRQLRLNEESVWSPIPIRYNMSRVSQYGTLEGFENITQGRNLKVTPFVTGGFTQLRPSANPLGDFETDKDFDGGLDLKYSLTPSLTLDATYRTDFAQVEVDQQQVNLTRFNLFFPEQRDFFLENSGIFDFGADNNLVPFFSRRIGLGRNGTPIPIVGGARVTGQIGRYDVGFLSMKSESQGSTPANNYVVGRIKGNFLTNSWVGGMLTNRDSTIAGDYNRVYGADVHLQFYSRLEFDTHILKSETPGLEGRDQAREFQAAWRDDEFVLAASYNEIQTNFNPEVGFVRRRNNTRYSGDASWNPLIESSSIFRNLIFRTRLDYFKDGTTDQIETREERIDLGIRFEDNSSIDFGVIETFDRLTDPFQIRSDILIPQGDYSYLGYSAGGGTNPGRKLSGSGSIEWGEFWSGDRTSFNGSLSYKLNSHFKTDINYTRNTVNLRNGEFTNDLVGARFLYAFNPSTFLNAFVQYNADTRQVSSNIRFNIIHSPLSDFFLVYNDLRDTSSGQVVQRAVIIKLTNLFNF